MDTERRGDTARSPTCGPGDHHHPEDTASRWTDVALNRAADIFRAMGDGPRLRLLELLSRGEMCVTEIVEGMGEKFSTISQRLRLLRSQGLVVRRREGTHVFYALADRHVVDLIFNALAHASELEPVGATVPRDVSAAGEGDGIMTHKSCDPKTHTHQHGPDCGHTGIRHEGHVDYLHDGHLHHMGHGGVEEHQLKVDASNPSTCTPKHDCGKHDKAHRHGPDCGHEAVPHGDHVDYLVDGHLHHPHGDHCDDHGKVSLA